MKRAVIASLCILAAACQNEAAPPPADEGTGAKGEVLEGTIDDAMLPLDTIVVPQDVLTATDEESADDGGAPEVGAEESGT